MQKYLCTKCINEDNERKWYPVSIHDLEKILERKIFSENTNDYRYALRKNIAYNLQYLEFQIECFNQLSLSSVLYVQNYKIFILVAASIIEGILFHELKRHNLYKRTFWNKISTIMSNEKNILNKKIRLETYLYEHIGKEKEQEMSFDQMLQKTESKKLLGDNHNIYASIKTLRKLRNKIHLHLADSNIDTDYNSFDFEKLELAKRTLLKVLKIYLSLTDEEVDRYFNYLKAKEGQTFEEDNNGLTLEEASELGLI